MINGGDIGSGRDECPYDSLALRRIADATHVNRPM